MKQSDQTQPFAEAVRSFPKRHPYLCTAVLCLSCILLYPQTQSAEQLPFLLHAQSWMLVMIPLLIVLGIFLLYKGKLTDGRTALLLIAAGFCMRLAYVIATPYYIRQHDVGRFDGDDGHAAYITYLYEHMHLPDFDVREVWQFYHPPLHHSIAALWMRLLTGCGISFEHAGESVQLLTLSYSCLTLVLFWQILRHFQLKGLAMAVPLAVMAFHPTFIILAGSVNNDMLCITLMLASVLLTLRWFREPKLSTILKLALTIGLGMMAKLSAWMAAPAAAAAFLVILYRNRKAPLPYLKQFVLFGIVCVPLGLWWGIRNLLRWGVPIAYVPMLSDNSSQFVGNIPFWRRLFDFSAQQWTYVYDCFKMYGQSYDEFNPLMGLLKTAMFDELINPEYYPAIAGFGELLFFSQILLCLLAAAAMTAVCRKHTELIGGMEKVQLCMTFGITLISYYSFCLAFAHVCTQNIRYATPLIFISCLFLGLWMQQLPEKSPLRKVICGAAVLFAAASYIVYYVVCG